MNNPFHSYVRPAALLLPLVLLGGALAVSARMGHAPNHAPVAEELQPVNPVGGLRVSLRELGLKSDDRVVLTPRLQAAIDEVAAKGGGTLVVPKGVFVSGAIFLKPGVNLHLEAGAVLKGSTNLADYPKRLTRIEGRMVEWIPALINAEGCDHLRLTGAGTLDGSGQVFYSAFWAARKVNPKVTNLAVERPRLVFVSSARDVLVQGLGFKNSGFWNLHLYRCEDVTVEGVRFEAPYGKAPYRGPSTDGVDIDSCQRVTVRGCHFAVNDDCVCLKGSKGPFAWQDTNSPPTEAIRVSHCTFAAGHGVVTLGSEASIIRDVVVEHCEVSGPMPLARFKLRGDTPQLYENIQYRDIKLAATYKGALIEVAPWGQFFDLQGQQPPQSTVRQVTFTGITGSAGAFGEIRGNPGQTKITDLTMKDIDVRLKQAKLSVAPGVGLTLENVRVNGKPFTLTAKE